MSNRRADLANSLRLWATCEKAQTQAIDDGLRTFIAGHQKTLSELKETEVKIKELETKRLKASHELFTAWYNMTEKVVGNVRTAATNDLVFWNRLIKLSPETYDFLQPRWERLERLLVSSQVREHNEKKGRTEKVAKLLSSSAGAEPATSNKTGEDHEEDEKG